MYVSKLYAVFICAALAVVTSYEEKDMRCRNDERFVPSFKVCDGVRDCSERSHYHGYYGNYYDADDEDREICAPEHIRMNTPELTSLAHQNGSLLLSWTWSVPPSSDLAGFYLRGRSSDHIFQTTLSATLSAYTTDCLKGYTQYDITLRPFYNNADGHTRLGRAEQLTVRSPATNPEAPRDIVVLSQPGTKQGSAGEVVVTIFEPISWNSNPLGFRLRWESNDQSNQPAKDFDLPLNVSESKKNLDVKLPLKPGREYTLFASARGVGDLDEVFIGPEKSVTVETAPVDPANLSAETIDPTSVIISWQAASPARSFLISRSSYVPRQPTLTAPSYLMDDDLAYSRHGHAIDQDLVPGMRLETSSIVLDGSSQESSFYRLPVFNLSSSVEYTVDVKACGAKVCSSEKTLLFTTPPSGIPTPIITTVLSNDTSSLYLEWNFTLPQQATDLSPEFEVRVKRNGFYRLIHTVEKAITIGNLSAGTEYEIQVVPSLERTPGKREYGSPASATISTWPLVPLAPKLSTRGFQTAPDVAVLSWTFLNSTVTHVEVATNYSNWVNCENVTECDVIVLHGWNSSFKAGFVRISKLRAHTVYNISARGCNDLGCGDDDAVLITTDMSEPSEPRDVTVNATEDGSAFLQWKAPNEPGGPLTGYVVSWQCDQGHLMAATTDEAHLVISGLPDGTQECVFSVSAFNVATGERQLRGKSASLKTSWPPQN